LLVPLDDGNGCAQSSEQGEPAVENETGASHDPEEAAPQVFEDQQGKSLARRFAKALGKHRLGSQV